MVWYQLILKSIQRATKSSKNLPVETLWILEHYFRRHQIAEKYSHRSFHYRQQERLVWTAFVNELYLIFQKDILPWNWSTISWLQLRYNWFLSKAKSTFQRSKFHLHFDLNLLCSFSCPFSSSSFSSSWFCFPLRHTVPHHFHQIHHFPHWHH